VKSLLKSCASPNKQNRKQDSLLLIQKYRYPDAMSDKELKVFFDGGCRVCDREISIYQKSVAAHRIEFIDITGTNFNANLEGLDSKKVHEIFHVKNNRGQIFEGVLGFREIWKTLPEWGWAYRLTRPIWIQGIMNVGYRFFLRIRPYLPRKKKCEI
jgi:predicted DCC family thiol-disulfide oxidoreductase YuxK